MKLKRKFLITIHDKYITTPEFNKLKEHFDAKLKQVNLASKSKKCKFSKKDIF